MKLKNKLLEWITNTNLFRKAYSWEAFTKDAISTDLIDNFIIAYLAYDATDSDKKKWLSMINLLLRDIHTYQLIHNTQRPYWLCYQYHYDGPLGEYYDVEAKINTLEKRCKSNPEYNLLCVCRYRRTMSVMELSKLLETIYKPMCRDISNREYHTFEYYLDLVGYRD